MLRTAEGVGSSGMAYRACEVDMAEARTIRGTFWLKKAVGLVAPVRESFEVSTLSASLRLFAALHVKEPQERETYCAWQRGRAVERSSWTAAKDLEERRGR